MHEYSHADSQNLRPHVESKPDSDNFELFDATSSVMSGDLKVLFCLAVVTN